MDARRVERVWGPARSSIRSLGLPNSDRGTELVAGRGVRVCVSKEKEGERGEWNRDLSPRRGPVPVAPVCDSHCMYRVTRLGRNARDVETPE